MQKLDSFNDDINKCSKCGLCQSVCPVYKVTGNDCAVSRGKFIMLKGILNGDLKLNKIINKYLDLCLKCGKCSEFCPSGIDACKIFETAKYEYVKNTFWGKLVFALQSKYVFNTFVKFFNILLTPFRKFPSTNYQKGLKLLYFKGCINTLYPAAYRQLGKIFKNQDIKIIEKDFDCCGLPFLSSGNLKRFEEAKQRNLKNLNCSFDYILTDCASCENTLRQYIVADFISIGELILRQGLKFRFSKPLKVTFHKPCHLKSDEFLEPLLKNCENIQYIKMDNYDDCCGFAGEFALKSHKISSKISAKKADNIMKTGADYVITTCPSCILGLYQGLLGGKNPPKPVSLTDFLCKAEIIYE